MLTSMTCPPVDNDAMDDLIRLPANSKSRVTLEEEHTASEQHQHCNSFLSSIGVNRDLVDHPRTFCKAVLDDPYVPPVAQKPHINQEPEDLAADLYQCATCKDCIYTVEDKGPSVLWRMRNFSIFTIWYNLMANCTDRWEIQDIANEEFLKMYRTILDSTLPKA